MAMEIAITGTRDQLTESQYQILTTALDQEPITANYHVGDAKGVDSATQQYLDCTIYYAEGRQSWQLASRSARMIKAIANKPNAKLLAFPNKPCPDGVKPTKSFNGKGSGTWGTIAYAKAHGLDVEVHPLTDGWELPSWLKKSKTPQSTQLTLF